MTGKAGANQFVFSAPGASNTIVDFGASSTNELVFSNSGFSLGQSGANATPQALPTTLFASNSTGAFGTTAQRFAYDTANGQLLYDAQGSASGSTPQLVATLTGHPAISAATQLFFVS
jgi:Ca2+-binding RTX toxin-like protein